MADHPPLSSSDTKAPAIWPPLPDGPPPTDTPADGVDAVVELTQLLHTHQITTACSLLHSVEVDQAVIAVRAAFRDVPWATSAFLLALHNWPPTAPRSSFFTLLSLAVKIVSEHSDAVPPQTSAVAGSLLLNAMGDARPFFVVQYVRAFSVNTADIERYCLRLLDVHVTHAVTVVDALDMRHLLPLPLVISAACTQNDLHAADTFVKGNRQHQLVYIEALIDQRQPDKAIRKRLAKFNIQEQTFPAFMERRVKASIRYLIYSKDYDEVLCVIEANPDHKVYACRFMLEQRGKDDELARLLIHRAGVADFFPDIDTSNLDGMAFPDRFDLEPLAHCLSLPQLIGEDNCVFVETPAQLQACVGHLRTAPVVGFDCEWKATSALNQAQSEACAVLQLASATRAFVVDMIALKAELAPLLEILQSPSIVKLGFDTKGDLHVLAKVLPVTDGPLFQNLIDIQALVKQVQRMRKPRTVEPADEEFEDGEVPDETAPDQVQGTSSAGEVAFHEQAAPRAAPASEEAEPVRQPKRAKGESESKGSTLSLTGVAELYLGKPLDKRARMSNWEQRPLSKAQLHYAALDAYVLVAIFQEMHKRVPSHIMESTLAKAAQRTDGGVNKPKKHKRKHHQHKGRSHHHHPRHGSQ